MGDGGFEPPTSSMSSARLPTCLSMALAGARYVLRLGMGATPSRNRGYSSDRSSMSSSSTSSRSSEASLRSIDHRCFAQSMMR